MEREREKELLPIVPYIICLYDFAKFLKIYILKILWQPFTSEHAENSSLSFPLGFEFVEGSHLGCWELEFRLKCEVNE